MGNLENIDDYLSWLNCLLTSWTLGHCTDKSFARIMSLALKEIEEKIKKEKK